MFCGVTVDAQQLSCASTGDPHMVRLHKPARASLDAVALYASETSTGGTGGTPTIDLTHILPQGRIGRFVITEFNVDGQGGEQPNVQDFVGIPFLSNGELANMGFFGFVGGFLQIVDSALGGNFVPFITSNVDATNPFNRSNDHFKLFNSFYEPPTFDLGPTRWIEDSFVPVSALAREQNPGLLDQTAYGFDRNDHNIESLFVNSIVNNDGTHAILVNGNFLDAASEKAFEAATQAQFDALGKSEGIKVSTDYTLNGK
jgi:hypothetical protein